MCRIDYDSGTLIFIKQVHVETQNRQSTKVKLNLIEMHETVYVSK
jgi:hypothetical protein